MKKTCLFKLDANFRKTAQISPFQEILSSSDINLQINSSGIKTEFKIHNFFSQNARNPQNCHHRKSPKQTPKNAPLENSKFGKKCGKYR